MDMQEELIARFYQKANPEQAAKMAAYMKNLFPFLGIPKPDRAVLWRDFILAARKDPSVDWQLIFRLWDMPEREFQYLALEYLLAVSKGLGKEDIEQIKELVTKKSWWDTVDCLAAQIVGGLCAANPELIASHMLKWAETDNIWLARTAILFQLKYKAGTDTEVLRRVILLNCPSKEFFVNKAIGWALREFSKTDRPWVKSFIDSQASSLSPLSLREGGKYI